MIEPISRRVEVEELKNYGFALHPLYTIEVKIEQTVRESPDTIHRILTDTGLISRATIPFEVVSNFRGSADNKPFYSATIIHEGIERRYTVAARDTGGLIRSRIDYEPVIQPEELKLVHPAEFARMGIEVKDWELHNYHHYFMLFISSRHYESFDIVVKAKRSEEDTNTSVWISLAESDLRTRRVPCSWYLNKLAVFSGLEEEVRRRISSIDRLQK